MDVFVFYLNVGQTGEFAFKDASDLKFKVHGNTEFRSSNSNKAQFSYTQGEGVTVVEFSNGVLAYLLDKHSAWNFFAPPMTSNPAVKPDEHIFVLGPYLVRSASIQGSMVEIIGDNANTTSLEFVPCIYMVIPF